MPFKIVRNDITKMTTEAIVNTANDNPTVGTGCDHAVYEAAGHDELLSYRKEKIGFVPEGDAFITPGFGLPAKYIIHAVSPFYIDGSHKEEELLRSCYRKSLALAAENGIRSIAFPLISTGGFGYPKEEGMRIAVDEIHAFLLTSDMQVYLVVFDEKATRMGQSLDPDLEAYIDEHYVEERHEEEYGDFYDDEESLILPKKRPSEENAPYYSPDAEKNADYATPTVFSAPAGSAQRRPAFGSPASGNANVRREEKKPGFLKSVFGKEKKAAEQQPYEMPAEAAPYEHAAKPAPHTEAAKPAPHRDVAKPAPHKDTAKPAPYFSAEMSLEEEDAAIEELERKLEERLAHLPDTFAEYLFYLIDAKGLTNADVYKKAIVDKKVFSKIKNNPDYHPQKETALRLCIGARLNLDESKDLLARAGYALSPCDKRDVIFTYFIEHGIYDMIELDIRLEDHGLPCCIV